jgi:hypothetical protein
MSGKGQRRKRSKYPGLDKSVNSKLRHEIIDHDYIEQLSDEEKEWLSNFNEEYISGNFSKGDKFHPTKEEKRECYTRNNARNRCIFSISNATKTLIYLDENDLGRIVSNATPETEYEAELFKEDEEGLSKPSKKRHRPKKLSDSD